VRTLSPVKFKFAGTLRGYQQAAVNACLSRDFGIIEAPTGSGKTTMALGVIAARKQPTLVIVHTKELLNQWGDRIEQFLDIPRDQIGIIGDGKMKIGEKITIAIINSLYPVAYDIQGRFGHVVVDECHRCPSRTFSGAVEAFEARFRLGLSATPFRRDGLTKLIGWYLGSTVKVDATELTGQDIVQSVEVVRRMTSFETRLNAAEQYSRVLSELTENDDRNIQIAADVYRESKADSGVCLILSDRREHCEKLAYILNVSGMEATVLTGATPKKERESIVERLNVGEIRVLIATGQLIGEGFDAMALQTLFLATPIKFSGRLIQYLGRILRPAPGKTTAKIYDYVDQNVGVLAASARARQQVYSQKGWVSK
jgi:superfamily II DNA or RNA helicase